ncbi:GDSL-type esterase/lipase family protein [Caldalkalibacillus salinus]|uniref:GDSL-type esterase/lipase family protein n=1 Tax=Caldalkalibacillus salinus TaxID=2803787 RepID=UPI00192306CF|nr:GDSL-type esterase/lipase family protein [Caldalkalibacillus salinus]
MAKKKKKRGQNALFYVALGDSLSLGIGAILKSGFVKRYKEMAENTLGKEIHHFIFAKHGATTGEILKKLEYKVVRQAIKHARIITITAGGNDLRRASDTFVAFHDQKVLERALNIHLINLESMLEQIDHLKRKQKKRYIIRLVDLYNPYPGSALADKWIRRFNKELRSFEGGHIKVTDVYHAFKGREKELLFLDHLHPNAEGYQVIANELHHLGYR